MVRRDGVCCLGRMGPYETVRFKTYPGMRPMMALQPSLKPHKLTARSRRYARFLTDLRILPSWVETPAGMPFLCFLTSPVGLPLLSTILISSKYGSCQAVSGTRPSASWPGAGSLHER